MKFILITVLMAFSLSSFSQKDASATIVLTKGQNFIVRDTTSQEADMGMGITMKNNSTTENKFVVLNAEGKNYTGTKTLTGIKMSMDMAGQMIDYDSDKKEDSASEIGKSVQNLNIPDTFSLDKYTGKTTFIKKPKTDTAMANPLENMFESMSNGADQNSNESFFVIPDGKKDRRHVGRFIFYKTNQINKKIYSAVNG